MSRFGDELAFGVQIIGAIAVVLIGSALVFGPMLLDLINDMTARPAICATYHGAECVAAMQEVH